MFGGRPRAGGSVVLRLLIPDHAATSTFPVSRGAVRSGGAPAATSQAGGQATGHVDGRPHVGSLASASVTGGTNTITGAATVTTVNGGTTTVGGVATITTLTTGTLTFNGASGSIGTLTDGTFNLNGAVATVGTSELGDRATARVADLNVKLVGLVVQLNAGGCGGPTVFDNVGECLLHNPERC